MPFGEPWSSSGWWGVQLPPVDYTSWQWSTITTTNSPVIEPPPPAKPLEDELRRIVREEIAELPIQFDVPDAPPEGEA